MKGIMFTEELFPKVVSGEKDMTRRIIKPQPTAKIFSAMIGGYYDIPIMARFWTPDPSGNNNLIIEDIKPLYKVGEILYLKEPCGAISGIMFYAYDYNKDAPMRKYFHGWRNKMFMPASLARFKIQITDVGVQRAQDITEADAIREGFENRAGFESAWIKINGISSWKPNPWVWVYEFKRV